MRELRLGWTDRYILLDDEDYDRCSKHTWGLIGTGQGALKATIDSQPVYLVHFIMQNKRTYDHKDRNPLNNQKTNFREANHHQNMQNRDKFEDGIRTYSSKHKGVSKCNKNKWRAKITYSGKVIILGYFYDEIDAAKAYNDVAIKYHGEFAVLNKV